MVQLYDVGLAHYTRWFDLAGPYIDFVLPSGARSMFESRDYPRLAAPWADYASDRATESIENAAEHVAANGHVLQTGRAGHRITHAHADRFFQRNQPDLIDPGSNDLCRNRSTRVTRDGAD